MEELVKPRITVSEELPKVNNSEEEGKVKAAIFQAIFSKSETATKRRWEGHKDTNPKRQSNIVSPTYLNLPADSPEYFKKSLIPDMVDIFRGVNSKKSWFSNIHNAKKGNQNVLTTEGNEILKTEEKMINSQGMLPDIVKSNERLNAEQVSDTQSDNDEKEIKKIKYTKNFSKSQLNSYKPSKHRSRIRDAKGIKMFIILPDDAFKTFWGSFVLLLLLYATIITPYRIAFYDIDSIGWIIADTTVDLLFLADLILNFFFAYYDEDEKLIYDRKKIALKYLTGWFIIDFVAIVPFGLFQSRDYNSLSRLTRLPRLYRLLKLTKIVRTFRVVREKNNWLSRLEKYIPSLSVAGERLFAFMIILILLCHITACLWFLVSKLEDYYDNWVVRYGYQDSTNFQIYTVSFYFTITTITTVGYGDMSAGTTTEHWFGICLMIIGVVSYSFAISSLTSLLSEEDIKETKKLEALECLHQIDNECDMDTGLYLELKEAVAIKFKKVEYLRKNDHLMKILPRELKTRLNSAMHERLVRQALHIAEDESNEFLGTFSEYVKPRKYLADDQICMRDDPIDEIYFLLNGIAEYVLPQFNDLTYMKITQGYFGDLDMVKNIIEGNSTDGKRTFSVKALDDCEILVLNKTDLFRLYQKYPMETAGIFEGAEARLQRVLAEMRKNERVLETRQIDMKRAFRRRTSMVARPGIGNAVSLVSQGSYVDVEEKSESRRNISSVQESFAEESSKDIVTQGEGNQSSSQLSGAPVDIYPYSRCSSHIAELDLDISEHKAAIMTHISADPYEELKIGERDSDHLMFTSRDKKSLDPVLIQSGLTKLFNLNPATTKSPNITNTNVDPGDTATATKQRTDYHGD